MMTQLALRCFDFVCPFCDIAQDRNQILREAALIGEPDP
jgi:hypothetical protein